MGYSTNDNGIIKGTPFSWLLILGGVIAIFAAIYLFGALMESPAGRHPPWAPEGCSVYRRRVVNPVVVVVVLNEENFNTEAECAKVILDALENEAAFFADSPEGFVPRSVEIQFPGEVQGTGPILQYSEIRQARRDYNLLRMYGIRDGYNNEQITLEQLEEVADGTLELGFLNWQIIQVN